MKQLIKKAILNSRFFRFYIEEKIKYSEIKRFKAESESLLHTLPPRLNNIPINKLYKDYLKELRKRRIQFSEYFFQYEFWNLSDKERLEFITRSEMQRIYRRLIKPTVREVMHNKHIFLNKFQKYVSREWLCLKHDDNSWANQKNEFISLLSNKDCIIKPISGSLGQGIFKTNKLTVNVDTVYEQLKNNDILIEECIEACNEIESFNPDSLNTVRVVTISNKSNAIVFGAFIRLGRKGSVVDNAHAGGIFAQINVDSGIIESNGINTNGEQFPQHPDSGKQIIGFKIPYWDKIKQTCIEAALQEQDLIFGGWDIALLPNGKVEIVECNHAPDFDVMQSPLKIGVKHKLFKTMKDLGIQ